MNTEDIITGIHIAQALSALDRELAPSAVTPQTGHKVIVRGDRSGVFYGTLVERHGTEVTLADCRHIWYWSGAANTAEIALRGVSNPNGCKIVAPVPRVLVLDAIEVIDCTPVAVASLDAVPEWSKA